MYSPRGDTGPEHGQSTIEYVLILAIVALLLVALTGAICASGVSVTIQDLARKLFSA